MAGERGDGFNAEIAENAEVLRKDLRGLRGLCV
jgi:hypothetical protein